MPLRLLFYFVRVWNKQVEGQAGRPRLWPILPVVLAQDKKRWKTSEHFRDLFGLSSERWEAVRGFTPDFVFRLLQLVDVPYEEIRGTQQGGLALRALRAEVLGELLHEAVLESALLGGVSVAVAERFFRYMLNAGIDREALGSTHGAIIGRPLITAKKTKTTLPSPR